MRDRIISEIRRLAAANGGQAPGVLAFERDTAILEHQWRGRIWSRWGDALADAGFEPNVLQPKLDTAVVLEKLVGVCRHYRHLPTGAEMQLYKRSDPAFHSTGAITRHFGNQAGMIAALAQWAADNNAADIAAILPAARVAEPSRRSTKPQEGSVYLIKSGPHYKIGRSDELERRVKEIRIALPDAATLEHTITTDDPPGIEAYWHRRFVEKRANGEWFKLTSSDVLAFKRRKFQ